ncbi:hypothetical protein [Rhodococcus koreensis]
MQISPKAQQILTDRQVQLAHDLAYWSDRAIFVSQILDDGRDRWFRLMETQDTTTAVGRMQADNYIQTMRAYVLAVGEN